MKTFNTHSLISLQSDSFQTFIQPLPLWPLSIWIPATLYHCHPSSCTRTDIFNFVNNSNPFIFISINFGTWWFSQPETFKFTKLKMLQSPSTISYYFFFLLLSNTPNHTRHMCVTSEIKYHSKCLYDNCMHSYACTRTVCSICICKQKYASISDATKCELIAHKRLLYVLIAFEQAQIYFVVIWIVQSSVN